ncbi:dynamin family protein [Microcoleus sp. A2-C5]|uniref:dynamin family protein n=1 Tax=unclassified Microcoleus TaxID=2642155 RepID=UPI002FD0ED5C
MTQKPHQCENLEAHVNRLLRLLEKEKGPSLRGKHDTAAIRTSRDKAIAPRFEIVFAGTYSAGKSMLINALLGQNLLYSNTGHATGLECYIEYAKSLEEERDVLTFLSISEIQEEVNERGENLRLKNKIDITNEQAIKQLVEECATIIKQEGGSKNTEKGEEANGLKELLEGFQLHRKYIHSSENKVYEREELGPSAKDSHNYAGRGSSSAVLKRIDYYRHHQLLEDGNVLIDLPGIDAPVKRDAQLTSRKVEDTNTSAVVCVMKANQEGETETAEKRLIQVMRENTGIRDRVFYVFNLIDKTWRNPKLEQDLSDLISTNFNDTPRGFYKTSALLGFWACQIKNTSESDRWGLNSILATEPVQNSDGVEGIPHEFVREFLDYCDSDKLPVDKFPDIVLRKNKSKNEKYIEILNLYKDSIIEQLIQDSGIQEFSNAITRYLTEEKRPELFANLASDISELCNDLRESYLEERSQWKEKPASIAEITEQDLAQVDKEVWEIGEEFYRQIEEEIQRLVMDTCEDFKQDFNNLHQKMQDNLTQLIENFSILDTFANTCRNYRHVTAPLVAVLGQAFYDIANGLENVLVKESEILITSFFQRLIKRVRKQKYHRQLGNLLLNDDCEIVQELQDIQKKVIEGVKVLASAECVFYIIESPDLYDYKDSVWLYQFRETLQEASNSRDVKRMVEAEASIRQLLEIDFQAKFKQTIEVDFGLKIIKMLNEYLLSMAESKRQLIWQQSACARANKRQAIEKDAQAKIDKRSRKLGEVEVKISDYNQAVAGINSCLEAMKLDDYKLPTIPEDNSSTTPDFIDVNSVESNNIPPESTSSFDSENDSSATQNYSEPDPVESDDSPEPGASPSPLARPHHQAAQSESSKQLQRGQLVEGRVNKVTPDVVVVNLDSRVGLLHKSNVSGGFVILADLFKENQLIKVMIVTLNDDKGRISLSTKVLENYKGEILENMEQVMTNAEARVPTARKKLPKLPEKTA